MEYEQFLEIAERVYGAFLEDDLEAVSQAFDGVPPPVAMVVERFVTRRLVQKLVHNQKIILEQQEKLLREAASDSDLDKVSDFATSMEQDLVSISTRLAELEHKQG